MFMLIESEKIGLEKYYPLSLKRNKRRLRRSFYYPQAYTSEGDVSVGPVFLPFRLNTLPINLNRVINKALKSSKIIYKQGTKIRVTKVA
jgi:hypothetical protein